MFNVSHVLAEPSTCIDCGKLLYIGDDWEPMLHLSSDSTEDECEIQHSPTCGACIALAEDIAREEDLLEDIELLYAD